MRERIDLSRIRDKKGSFSTATLKQALAPPLRRGAAPIKQMLRYLFIGEAGRSGQNRVESDLPGRADKAVLKHLLGRRGAPSSKEGPKRFLPRSIHLLTGLVLLIVVLFLLDHRFPLPTPGRNSPYAVVVLARDGTPLRAFPGEDHVWRHPISLDEVSPLYLDALVR